MTTDTEELRRLALAATRGPWEVAHPHAGDRGWEVKRDIEQVGKDFGERNAAFIAAANPAAVLELLDTLAVREAEIDVLKENVCRGIPRRDCNYLTTVNTMCFKCGKTHTTHELLQTKDENAALRKEVEALRKDKEALVRAMVKEA